MKFTESETVELISSTSELKEAIVSLSAMLNKHSKGMVYFGINDVGNVLGQQIGKSTLKDISGYSKHKSHPLRKSQEVIAAGDFLESHQRLD